MPELIISPEADEDLIEIWVYVAADRDPETADKLLDAFKEKFELLLSAPEMGRARDELAPYLRSIPQGNYMIFYRPILDSVEIIRVLHGARDIERLFSGEE